MRRAPRSRFDCLRGSNPRGTGNGGTRAGGERESPAEEITFDLFGAVEDFNDAVTSGDWTEKVHVTVLSVNACQGLSGNDVLEKAQCGSRVTFFKIDTTASETSCRIDFTRANNDFFVAEFQKL